MRLQNAKVRIIVVVCKCHSDGIYFGEFTQIYIYFFTTMVIWNMPNYMLPIFVTNNHVILDVLTFL